MFSNLNDNFNLSARSFAVRPQELVSPGRRAKDSGSRRMEASASGKQEHALRANPFKSTDQAATAHPSRALRPAFGVSQYSCCASLMSPASILRFSARLANRGAENAPAVSPGAGQDVACPAPVCLRILFAGTSPEMAQAFRRSCLNFLDSSLPPPAGLPFPVHLTRLEGKRKTKDRAAFPTDSPGTPAGRCRSVKPFAR